MQNAKLQNWGSFTILGIIRYHLYLTQMKWYTTEKLANTNCLPGLLKFLVENILNCHIDIMASCSCKINLMGFFLYITRSFSIYCTCSPISSCVLRLVVLSFGIHFLSFLFQCLTSWSSQIFNPPHGQGSRHLKTVLCDKKEELRWCTYEKNSYYIWTLDKE